MVPEQEEDLCGFLQRVFSAHRLDILVVHNAEEFARLCGHRSFEAAEPLWRDLAGQADRAKCQVTLIRHEG